MNFRNPKYRWPDRTFCSVRDLEIYIYFSFSGSKFVLCSGNVQETKLAVLLEMWLRAKCSVLQPVPLYEIRHEVGFAYQNCTPDETDEEIAALRPTYEPKKEFTRFVSNREALFEPLLAVSGIGPAYNQRLRENAMMDTVYVKLT